MRVSDGSPKIILLHLSLSRIFSGSAKANRECRMRYLCWFELLILRPDALPVTNNTLLLPGPRRYSLRRSIVMPDRRAYIYIYIYYIYTSLKKNYYYKKILFSGGRVFDRFLLV